MKGQMLDIAKAFFPILEETEETGEWVGIRSSIEDGVPIVGWTEKKGFLIAAFDSSGIQLAPAVGNIIAKQLLNGDPTEFYDRVSISRFKGHRDVKNKLD
jgi:glycine/D-amino acid oxidase-like deaminating enzyme